MKTHGEPCCNSKAMGKQLAHNIRIRLAHFFSSWVCSAKFTFFSMSFCGKWAWSPPDNATPSNFPPPKSWVSDLSFEVSFVSVLAMVLSEYWKRLEKNFRNYIIFATSSKKTLKKKVNLKAQTQDEKKSNQSYSYNMSKLYAHCFWITTRFTLCLH